MYINYYIIDNEQIKNQFTSLCNFYGEEFVSNDNFESKEKLLMVMMYILNYINRSTMNYSIDKCQSDLLQNLQFIKEFKEFKIFWENEYSIKIILLGLDRDNELHQNMIEIITKVSNYLKI